MRKLPHLPKDCYGCGMCVASCKHNAITLTLNANGFYEPILTDVDKCTRCGICLKVCAFVDSQLDDSVGKVNITGFSAWSNNEDIRKRCSSGGVGYELGRLLLDKGYKACGVRYNATSHHAEHFMTDSKQVFENSIGSKYIQSFTVNAFKQLNRKELFFVTGTPCQIDSVRKYIRLMKCEENYILMDFFCHGVPSMLMWEKYLSEVEKQIGKTSFVSWRNKKMGWHNSYAITARGSRKDYFSLFKGDLFYRFFLGNYCLGKACYKNCKYKGVSSAADIRIGDLWGSHFAKDNQGVSAVLAFTVPGREVVAQLQKACTITPQTLPLLLEGQMKKAPKERKLYLYTKRQLRTDKPLKEIAMRVLLIDVVQRFPQIVKNRFSKYLKRIKLG